MDDGSSASGASASGRARQQQLSEANQRAWDSLYQSTGLPVWGHEPAPFVGMALEQAARHLTRVDRCLDAGTGEGRNLPLLLKWASEVHGCDGSASALTKVPAALAAQVHLQQCDLSQLPYPAAHFDLVLSVDVLETLPELDVTLREFHRVLRPGGLLICNIPGDEDGIHGVEMAPAGEDGFLFREAFFYRFLSETDAVACLEGAGFRVLHMELCTWEEPPHPNFRTEPHEHTSRVFVVVRSE